MIRNVYVSSGKVPLLLSDINETRHLSAVFRKILNFGNNIYFLKIVIILKLQINCDDRHWSFWTVLR